MSADANALSIAMMVDRNPRYSPIDGATILVENTAESVIYRKENVKSKSSTSLSFSLDISDHFLDRGIYLTWDKIPLTATRSTPTDATGITKMDFHDTFFGNYKDLTMRQFGILNAINTMTVTLDGKTISTPSISEIMEQVSHFYSRDEVHQHFEASNPNLYYSNLVSSEADTWVPSISCDNEPVAIKASTLSENDPFSSAASDGYNSRVPLFSLSKEVAAATSTAEVVLHNVSTWLPFSILGINGDESPIYFGNHLQVNIELHQNWPNRIFQTRRPVAGTSPFTFTLDRQNWGTNDVGDIAINARLYRAPQYIQSKLDPKSSWIQSYTIVEQDTRTQDIVFTPKEKTKAVSSTPFDLRAVPKRIYIGVLPKRVDDDEWIGEAAHFCRFDSLSVEMNGTTTDIATGNSSHQIYNICKANGLTMTKNQYLYTLGGPVCLDISDNIGSSTNSYVGLSTSQGSGKYTLRIKGSITRLHHDTEAGDFDISKTEEKFFKRNAKTYELKLIVCYAGFLCHGLLGQKFAVIESLTSSELDSMSQHANLLYENYAPRMNVLGGSFISSLLPTLKNVGKGLFNVIKAAVTNQGGLRDQLIKAYKNEPAKANEIVQSVVADATAAGWMNRGGAFDNHAPILGGKFGMTANNTIGGQRGGRSIDSWASM